MFRFVVACWFALATIACFHRAVAAEVEIRVVATSEQEIPGGNGETFGDINLFPNVAPGGLVTFQGELAGKSSTNLWLWDDGSFEHIVGPATQFHDSWAQFSGSLNRHGEVLFVAKDETDEFVVGHYSDGLSSVLVRAGDPILGLPSEVTAIEAHSAYIRDDGTIRIWTLLEGAGVGPGNHTAFLYGNRDEVALWVQQGDAAPGIPGHVISCLCTRPVTEMVMHVVDTANPSDDFRAAWLNEGQDLELLLVESMSIPNSDLAIDHLWAVQSNENGDVIFFADTHDTKTNTPVGGMWYGAADHYELILPNNDESRFTYGVLAGDQASIFGLSTPNGAESLGTLLKMDVTQPDSLRLIAKEGELAPQTDRFFKNFILAGVNSRDDLIFTASTELNQTGFDHGMWVLPAGAEEPELLAIEGEMFDLGGGDLRMIESLSGNWMLTEDGYTTLRLVFEDGSSGVFLLRVVPEPSGLTFGLLAMLACWPRRRVKTA